MIYCSEKSWLWEIEILFDKFNVAKNSIHVIISSQKGIITMVTTTHATLCNMFTIASSKKILTRVAFIITSKCACARKQDANQ